MSQSWDIDPQATLGVIQTAAKNVEQQGARVKDLESALEAIGVALTPGLVPAALNGYVTESLGTELKDISSKSETTVLGTYNALKAYVQGDSQMAANAPK